MPSSSTTPTTPTTIIPHPQQQQRVNVALDAAKVGQLTRLPEHVIDETYWSEAQRQKAAQLREEAHQNQDGWNTQQGLVQLGHASLQTSTYLQVLHQAAAKGRQKMAAYEQALTQQRTTVTTTTTTTAEEQEEPPSSFSISLSVCEDAAAPPSPTQLVDTYVQKQVQTKHHALKNNSQVQLHRLEDLHASRQSLNLLSPVVPKFHRVTTKHTANATTSTFPTPNLQFSPETNSSSPSMAAAAAAAVTSSPSPQMIAKILKQPGRFFLGGGSSSGSNNEQDFLVRETLQAQVTQEAAQKAQERQLRIVTQGQLHMSGMCVCQYCTNPSPFQTQFYKHLAQGEDLTQAVQHVEASVQQIVMSQQQQQQSEAARYNHQEREEVELEDQEDLHHEEEEEEVDDEDSDPIGEIVSLHSRTTTMTEQSHTRASATTTSIFAEQQRAWKALKQDYSEDPTALEELVDESHDLYRFQVAEWHAKGFALTPSEQEILQQFQQEQEDEAARLQMSSELPSPSTRSIRSTSTDGWAAPPPTSLSSSSPSKKATATTSPSKPLYKGKHNNRLIAGSPLDDAFHEDENTRRSQRTTTPIMTILSDNSSSEDGSSSMDDDDDDDEDSFENLSEHEDSQHFYASHTKSFNGELSTYLQEQLREMELEDEDLVSRGGDTAQSSMDILSRSTSGDMNWRPLHPDKKSASSSVDESTIHSTNTNGRGGGVKTTTNHSTSRRGKKPIKIVTTTTTTTANNDEEPTLEDEDHEDSIASSAHLPLHLSGSSTMHLPEEEEAEPSSPLVRHLEKQGQPFKRVPEAALLTAGLSVHTEESTVRNSSRHTHRLSSSQPNHNTNRDVEDDRMMMMMPPKETLPQEGKDDEDAETSSLTSEERRLEEDEELDELNDLYDRRDNGQDVDENRLYELELFDRYRQGEDLTVIELEDLDFYKKRRRRTRHLVREYHDLCDLQDARQEVDEERMYFLELVARDQNGETLTDLELQDLDDFEAQEEAKEEAAKKTVAETIIKVAKPAQSIEALEPTATSAAMPISESVSAPEPVDEGLTDLHEPLDSTMNFEDDSSLSSREVDELNELLFAFEEGRQVDTARMDELDVYDRWRNGEQLDEKDEEQLEVYRRKRRKERGYRRELQDLIATKEKGGSIDEDRFFMLALFGRKHFMNDTLSFEEEDRLKEFLAQENTRTPLPKTLIDEEGSLDGDLFEKYTSKPAQPLLAAALKARKDADIRRGTPDHLAGIHQPKAKLASDDGHEDEKSLEDDIFDVAGPSQEKSLVAAALKAKREADIQRGSPAHLAGIHQPTKSSETKSDDDKSYDGELFDGHKPRPEQPLLQAALKARRDEDLRAGTPVHLAGFHQPKTVNSDRGDQDEDASYEGELFEEFKPKSEQPLLDAALKARKQEDIRSGTPVHLAGVHQPKKTNASLSRNGEDEDDKSYEGELFEEARPKSEQPLVDAALKARRDQDIRSGTPVHLAGVHQPKKGSTGLYSVGQDQDDETSYQGALFEDVKPRSDQPLVDAALKARRETDIRAGTPVHLAGVYQPKDDGVDEEGSLEDPDLFQKPSGPPHPTDSPIINAAIKAKASLDGKLPSLTGNTSGNDGSRLFESKSSIRSKNESSSLYQSRSSFRSTEYSDSSLSSRELEELNELMEEFEEGKPIDEGRMMDLDIFDRWMNGEDLDSTDNIRLEGYRKERKRERRYRREFQELLDKKEKGLEIDEQRLSGLSLFARHFLGETLRDHEFAELEKFHREERSLESAMKARSATTEAKHKSDEAASFDLVTRPAETQKDTSIHSDSSLSSRELDELNDLLGMYEDGKPVDRRRMTELDLFDRWKSGEDLDSSEQAQLDIYRKQRHLERSFRREFQELLDKKQHEEEVNEYRLACLSLFAREYVGDKLDAHEKAQLRIFLEEEQSSDTPSSQNGGATAEKEVSLRVERAVPEYADDCSSLSSGEQEELDDLTRKYEAGEVVEESRLYDLDLISRLKRGEELSSEEAESLKYIIEARSKERRYRREFNFMLDKRDQGEPVDENRFFCLELYARRYVGDDITPEEEDALAKFIASEVSSQGQADAIPASSHLRSMNQPTQPLADDDQSLGEDALFDKNVNASRPSLLDAAKRAKEQAESALRQSDESPEFDSMREAAATPSDTTAPHKHLDELNQPKSTDDDDASLGSNELFDERAAGPPPTLLQAALTAKAKADIALGDPPHLAGMSQPKLQDESDSESLIQDRLFEPSQPRPADERLLVAAALRARAQADIAAGTPEHLAGLHQPKVIDEKDGNSIGDGDIFETKPSQNPTAKPLLAAALKAKASSAQPPEAPKEDIPQGNFWNHTDAGNDSIKLQQEEDIPKAVVSPTINTKAEEPKASPSGFFSGLRTVLSSAFAIEKTPEKKQETPEEEPKQRSDEGRQDGDAKLLTQEPLASTTPARRSEKTFEQTLDRVTSSDDSEGFEIFRNLDLGMEDRALETSQLTGTERAADVSSVEGSKMKTQAAARQAEIERRMAEASKAYSDSDSDSSTLSVEMIASAPPIDDHFITAHNNAKSYMQDSHPDSDASSAKDKHAPMIIPLQKPTSNWRQEIDEPSDSESDDSEDDKPSPLVERSVEEIFQLTRNAMITNEFSHKEKPEAKDESESESESDLSKSSDHSSARKEIVTLMTIPSPQKDGNVELLPAVLQPTHWTDSEDNGEISEDERERREQAHAIALLQMQEDADYRRREAERQMDLAEKRLRQAEREEAKRKAALEEESRLESEQDLLGEDAKEEERKRNILLRLEAEEMEFKQKEEQRHADAARKAEELARAESLEAERREQAHQIALQQMAAEAERRRTEDLKRMQEEHELALAEEARQEEETLANLQKEKDRKKNEIEERKKMAAQQAMAAQGMAAQLKKQREERLERERLEAERQRLEAERLEAERREQERLEQEAAERERLEAERLEAERLEQERLDQEAAEREAELQRKRERIQELKRLKQIAVERERRMEEELRQSQARSATAAVPPPHDDGSGASFADENASESGVTTPLPRHLQVTSSDTVSEADTPSEAQSRGVYSFATVTSNRRYSGRSNRHRTSSSQQPQSYPRGALRIMVRPLLSWRSDPSESFSDWKILVRHQGKHQTDEYHVHRNIVGYGPRKSGYFAQEFIRFYKEKSSEPVSKLTLPSAQASVVPFCLDYLYLTEGDTQPTLTAEKACWVYNLADRLEMPTLKTTVAEFYKQHLQIKNMGKFLRAATTHQAPKLIFVAKVRIGSLITEDPTCARLLRPQFLGQLSDILQEHRSTLRSSLENNSKRSKSDFDKMERLQSKRWSRAIVYCSQAKNNVFEPSLLEGLVVEDVLPYIDGTAALPLLRLYETTGAGRRPSSDEKRTSLERRCALGLMEDWVLVQRQFASTKELESELHAFLPHKLEQEVLTYAASRYD